MLKKMTAILISLIFVITSVQTALTVFAEDAAAAQAKAEQLRSTYENAAVTGLFHDQGGSYMTPDEPEAGQTVTLRLRVPRYNVTGAQIMYTTDGGSSWNSVLMSGEGCDNTGWFDLWKGSFTAAGSLIYYRFYAENSNSGSSVYYDTDGISNTAGVYTNGWQIVPGHTVPGWAKGALWYSVVPDSFYNGSTVNDKLLSGNNSYASWSSKHRSQNDRYGGDLQGISQKLDYIDSLNVDAVYINPTSKSYHNVGYNVIRYDEVESAYGNEEDMARLASDIHSRGLKLMGDVVLTFAGENSYYFNKGGYWPVAGAYQSQSSEWYDMFSFNTWPDSFRSVWSSPEINLNSAVSRNLLYGSVNSYLQGYMKDFDGFRFDCGGVLWGTEAGNTLSTNTIISNIRRSLRASGNNALLLSEYDAANMNTGTWDSQWNISYMRNLQSYASGDTGEAEMARYMLANEIRRPRNVALCQINMLGSHDSQRVIQDKDYLYNAAVLLQMTYLGAPSIYYGDEINNIRENEEGIGSTGSYYAMEWDESKWDNERLSFYKGVTELRGEYSCVKTGAAKLLNTDDSANLLCFGRWDADGAVITAASQNEDFYTAEIAAKECDIADGTVLMAWCTVVKTPQKTDRAVGIEIDTTSFSNGITVRMMFSQGEKYLQVSDGAAGYLLDSAGVWSKTVSVSNSCFDIPAGFRGSLVIPLEGFTHGNWNNDGIFASEKLEFQFRVFGVKTADSVIYFDNIRYFNDIDADIVATGDNSTGVQTVFLVSAVVAVFCLLFLKKAGEKNV